MRKTLFAMLGLVAIGLWAIPVVAAPSGLVSDGPSKVRTDPVPLDARAGAVGAAARGERYAGTLSGSLIKQSAVTTNYFLYPGACVQRALGTWAAKTSPAADSLQPNASFPNSSGYTAGQPNPASNTIAYTRTDLSLPEKLWHIESSSTPAGQRPAILDGTRMIWCGKFDANWTDDVGYPNLTFQILYIDTGTHANPGGKYHLNFQGNFSSELNYDYVTFIGGGSGGALDPIGNSRIFLSDMLPPVGSPHGGPGGDSDQLVSFTGAIRTSQTISMNSGADLQIITGDASLNPVTQSYSLEVDDDHRGMYVVFTADCLFSSEDGLWPNSDGQSMDDIEVDNNGVVSSIYTDAATFVPPAGVSDQDASNGTVLVWSGNVIPQAGDDTPIPIISSRVPPGVGERWQLSTGASNVTQDVCSPQKALANDLFFEGGDLATHTAINKQYNAIVPCVFPIPAGSAQVLVFWNEYLDIPRFSGYVQQAEFRIFKFGAWGQWNNTAPGGGVTTGANQAWLVDGDDISTATQADSVQLRFELQCIPPFAADRANCATGQINPILYDDLRLQVVTGVPAPFFGIFPGSVAQTTFVDGRIGTAGIGQNLTNCTAGNLSAGQCWPGNRGSGLGTQQSHNIAVNNNFNAPVGDTITLSLLTGLRKNGMGINWKHGFNKSINAGEFGPPGSEYAHTNPTFNANCDMPRMIFRLFDPSSKTWSPWDSTELVANAVAPGPTDTTLVDSEFNIDWPPYDKAIANASIPGGFTINGVGNYNALSFLPRGARMQYYFKAVDIGNGSGAGCGVSYQFSSDNLAREVEDIPTLPNSSIKAPDIIEFRVLPSVYPAGPAGSLLAGRTNTPVLNLDAVYTTWAFGYDPMTQALRALGVRADRYRHTASGTTAHGFGGHELPGKRPDRLSNFFPNYLEYPLVDSLASWYRIVIESGHTRTSSVFNEEDAFTLEQWWRKETGTNGGDRCAFLSGDDQMYQMITPSGVDATFQISMAGQVFGVASAQNSWSPATSYFNMDDRFAAATAGPALAAPNTFVYPIDGGCPAPNRFDALTAAGPSGDTPFIAAVYPSGQAAAVGRMRELDNIGDNDRNKAIAYGFSLQFIRDPAISNTSANYTRSGVENRMRVMYKFLTSCRTAQVGPSTCFPCPNPTPQTIASMQADWSGQNAGFQTATYGSLYPIQAGALATAVGEDAPEAAPRINKIDGNYPNPFNPHTAIRFSSAQAGKAQIRIFSVSGALVRTLHTTVTAGPNEVRWNGKKDDGASLASGVYFYKIVFPNGESFRAPNNLVLVK
ncbi:MAG TPA: FlgD immunoglobulin-like domain containing protein [Candidatus Eisenbacteria bacterium]|nr:FlgD immunoglobulin-like domain containing protein [Candidatus Eisenbacteria bacterium]